MSTIYAGPGKVNMSSKSLHAEGNGRIVAKRVETQHPVRSGLVGTVNQLRGDLYAEVDITPFDDWAALGLLFPARLGISVGATAGALAIGGDAHTASAVPATIWTPDGRAYAFKRAAVTGHPDIHLGIDKPLFGGAKITCLGDLAKVRSDADFLMAASTPVTESAATDGGQALASANFIRGAWTGAFGSVTGFTAIEAEDEWTISVNATYNRHKVQQLTRKMTLADVVITVRVRPVGPTHTQLQAYLDAFAGGSGIGIATTDLVLTGPSSKTITLKNCGIVGGGFEFGGEQLGTGEIMFFTKSSLTTGAVDPLMVISA